METAQEVVILAPKDKTTIRFNNELGFKEPSRAHKAMQYYCWDVVFETDKSTNFYFYDFPDSQYGPTYRALITYFETYLQNPDNKTIINIDHYKNEEDRPYKTLVLTGELSKINPREAATYLSQGDVKHLKMTLINTEVETIIHEYPAPVLTFKEKLKALWAEAKRLWHVYFPAKPKQLSEIETKHLERTSYAACYTKAELENRVFDNDAANQVILETFDGIEDPESKIKDFRLKAFKGL
jgi:hypothetical protein